MSRTNGALPTLTLVRHDASMDPLTGYGPWLRAHDCCERTVTDRTAHLADFARAYPAFPHVSAADVTEWVGRPGLAQWSRGSFYGHLRSYFTFALEAGVVAVDPMARMRRPKPGKSVPRPLTQVQVGTVLGAASPHMRAWLLLSLYAGLRAHEVAKIRGEDVDADQLWVLGKGGVGVYLPTHRAIWELAQTMPRTGFWFPSSRSASGHVSSLTISTSCSRLFTAHGIPGSLHRGRHTFATMLLRAGVNIRVVQTLMRHASLRSTQIYTAVDEDERRDAIRLLAA